MSRLRPFRARVGVAGAASLAALSLLVTSLTPLAMRASAADESTQSPDVATSQEAATASSHSEAADAPANEAGVEAPAAEDGAEAPAAEAGAEAPAAEVAPENQPRTRRARAVADDQATLALNVVNDAETLRSHDAQITTINFSCSSVTTPCKGAEIELTLPGPITPDGLKLIERGYNVVPVTGDSVARTATYTENKPDGTRVQRYVFKMKDPLPAGTSDRIQVSWYYNYNDAPNNSTTTQKVTFSAQNAEKIENELTTTWTADTDIAIEKSGPTDARNYPAAGGEATYKLRYGYQQIDQDNPNKVGIRWNGSAMKSNQPERARLGWCPEHQGRRSAARQGRLRHGLRRRRLRSGDPHRHLVLRPLVLAEPARVDRHRQVPRGHGDDRRHGHQQGNHQRRGHERPEDHPHEELRNHARLRRA